jgi:hypothetical protein
MNPELWLAIASGLGGFVSEFLAKPKGPHWTVDEVMRPIETGLNREMESSSSSLRQTVGQESAAAGLTGGAREQVVGMADAEIRAKTQGEIARTRAALTVQHAQAEQDYGNAMNQWRGGLVGSVAQTGGAISGYLGEERHLKRISEILGQSVKSPTASTPKFGPKSGALFKTGRDDQRTSTQSFGGMNAWSSSADGESMKSVDQPLTPMDFIQGRLASYRRIW